MQKANVLAVDQNLPKRLRFKRLDSSNPSGFWQVQDFSAVRGILFCAFAALWLNSLLMCAWCACCLMCWLICALPLSVDR